MTMNAIDLYVGIDLSLRSTAVMILDKNFNIISMQVVTSTTKQYNDEELLIYNSKTIVNFITNTINDPKLGANYQDGIVIPIKNIAIERLSYASKSAKSDVISANSWILRCRLKDTFPTSPIQIVSVKEWRNKFLSDVEQRLINEQYPIIRAKRGMKLTKDETKSNNKNKALIKVAIKELTLSKIPDNIREIFTKYLTDNKIKVISEYDLADAYLLTKFSIGI